MKTILLVEDDVANAMLVERILTRHDYRLIQAADGEAAIALAAESTPDLILIDLGLPDIDGQTLIVLMREMDHLAGVPMVALTAWPPEVARTMAEAYGFDGYLSKPIDVRAFPGQIAAFLPG